MQPYTLRPRLRCSWHTRGSSPSRQTLNPLLILLTLLSDGLTRWRGALSLISWNETPTQRRLVAWCGIHKLWVNFSSSSFCTAPPPQTFPSGRASAGFLFRNERDYRCNVVCRLIFIILSSVALAAAGWQRPLARIDQLKGARPRARYYSTNLSVKVISGGQSGPQRSQ